MFALRFIVMRYAALVVVAVVCVSGLLAGSVAAKDPMEADYYPITAFPMSEYVSLEAGGLELLPNKQLAISTRRGDIYLLDKPFTNKPDDASLTLFAGGLHEVLGLAWKDNWLYATQRGEVTRLKDEDGDGRADLFETVSDGWEIGGNYHEYALGSKFDREGRLWVGLCLTGSFTSDVKLRGWAVRITTDGRLIPTCAGLRSPVGLGMNAEGD